MSDAGQIPPGFAPGAGQPTEEQMQAMLAQMRVLPVDQHLAQVLQLLLEGAQVKIGRNDGRLLLDATAVFVDHVRPYANAELVKQVDEALAQLRMAQVQAEAELQRAAVEEGHAESNDLSAPPRPPGQAAPSPDAGADGQASPGQPAAATAPPPTPSAASRLWTPGA